jgi:hypothetical protein
MTSPDPRGSPSRRRLVRHLGRLQAELDEVGQRLREMIAQALGRTIDQAVTESVHLALSGHSPLPSPPPARPAIVPGRSSSLWQEPAQPDWLHDEDDRYGYDLPELRDREGQAFDDDQQSDTNASDESKDMAWSRSLAVGLEIAAWWLLQDQPPSRRRLILVGLAAAGVTLLGGEALVLSARLALALLHLLVLADACQSGAGVLYRVANP